MKGRNLLGLGISLAILGAGALQVLAQSGSFPTNAEIQGLRQEFRQDSPNLGKSLKQIEPTSEIKSQESYIRAWSRVNPIIAPFLGEWVGDSTWVIFPSYKKGRVCLVEYIHDAHGGASFSLGTISNGKLRTNQEFFINGKLRIKPEVFVKRRAELLQVYPNSNPKKKFQFVALISRRASGNSSFENIRQKFNAAGCTTALPRRR